MPVTLFKSRKGPTDATRVKTALDQRVFRNIRGIVVVHESVHYTCAKCSDDKKHQQQRKSTSGGLIEKPRRAKMRQERFHLFTSLGSIGAGSSQRPTKRYVNEENYGAVCRVNLQSRDLLQASATELFIFD